MGRNFTFTHLYMRNQAVPHQESSNLCDTMLAFAKDITQSQPNHRDEAKNPELKNYMNYQRKLNHVRIVYYSLKHAKNELQENLQQLRKNGENAEPYLEQAFPLSHHFADDKTLTLMLKKLVGGHNEDKQWYRLNSYYYALAYDCMNRFIKHYNQMVRDSTEEARQFTFAGGGEIDFGDWVYLYFPHLDFHIGTPLDQTQYPFAKRNKTIEEEIDKKTHNGETLEKALKSLKEEYEIDDVAIKVVLHKKISHDDLELFHTSIKNPIYEVLTHQQAGSWEALDGETPMDQAYNFGSQMKIWTWGKKKKKIKAEKSP